MRLLRDTSSELGALPPTPRDLSLAGQNDYGGGNAPRPAIPAAESALGLRPRSALSSAQVLPEWITSTSPCNDLSANGDNPLNSLSHPRGSPHCGASRLVLFVLLPVHRFRHAIPLRPNRDCLT
jgi:hypothetical protein